MASRERPTPPRGDLDRTKSYTARIRTENGEIRVELFAADAPLTVENFVRLARSGFYDGTTFHRVIPGFMAQGGDPTGTGRGGPGYQFADEFGARRHDAAGVLSMANAGPNTNGSQFFITFGPTPHLDGRHTVFGRVIEGMDVLRSLSERDPQTARAPGDRIETVEIEERCPYAEARRPFREPAAATSAARPAGRRPRTRTPRERYRSSTSPVTRARATSSPRSYGRSVSTGTI